MDKEDKFIELHRYEKRALAQLSVDEVIPVAKELGSSSMPQYLRSPYIFYEKCVSELVSYQDQVLELGAGSGLHTWVLVQTGAEVTATDISRNSLKLLKMRFAKAGGRVKTQFADIESLPFAENAFDVVACAGSLSYGEPALVDAEIKRVLRPGGLFICVDSLNHNPIYRFNRWLHYQRGARTKSTLNRIPDIDRVESFSQCFDNAIVRYFGSLSFVMPPVARLCGMKRAQAVSDYFDRLIDMKRSAFKFVLVAKGLIGIL